MARIKLILVIVFFEFWQNHIICNVETTQHEGTVFTSALH